MIESWGRVPYTRGAAHAGPQAYPRQHPVNRCPSRKAAVYRMHMPIVENKHQASCTVLAGLHRLRFHQDPRAKWTKSSAAPATTSFSLRKLLHRCAPGASGKTSKNISRSLRSKIDYGIETAKARPSTAGEYGKDLNEARPSPFLNVFEHLTPSYLRATKIALSL